MHFCRPIRKNAWIRGVLGDVKPIQELPEFLDQSESLNPSLTFIVVKLLFRNKMVQEEREVQ